MCLWTTTNCGKLLRKWEYCQGPASAGSRGTLRMNGVGEKRREREKTHKISLDRAKSAKERERKRKRERE